MIKKIIPSFLALLLLFTTSIKAIEAPKDDNPFKDCIVTIDQNGKLHLDCPEDLEIELYGGIGDDWNN